jgi:hypothetical protein
MDHLYVHIPVLPGRDHDQSVHRESTTQRWTPPTSRYRLSERTLRLSSDLIHNNTIMNQRFYRHCLHLPSSRRRDVESL